jgi:spore germination protein KC
MKIKLIKFILIFVFLFSLAYANKDKIPYPVELKTIDFIISSGVDIDLNAAKAEEKCSISYVTDEQKSDGANSNKDKKIFNIKSDTLFKTIEKLQSLTNKSLSSSHLEYVLIGEETARENLEYFAKYYSKTPKIRLDIKVFAVKDLTSEEFLKKALTSDININDRLNGIANDRDQLSYLTKKNLKDLLQITYNKTQTGVIPALHIIESPEQKAANNSDNSEESGENEKKDAKEENKSYTFGYYGLGIIKNGKLIDYLPHELIRSYLMLTKSVKNTTIETQESDENGNNTLFAFQIENTSNKTSFEFDKDNNLSKVIFNISIDTSYEETDSQQTGNISDSNHLENLNILQTDIIKREIEKIILISKELDTDFLGIGEMLSIQHPYKWHFVEEEWSDIFKDLEYETNVSIRIKRYYNIK